MMEVMKKRSEIPEYLKWDISSLYQTESDYERDLKKCEQMSVDIEKKYKNKIVSPDTAICAIREYNEFLELNDVISHYATLSVSVDMTDAQHQKRESYYYSKAAEIQTRLKFLEKEIVSLDAHLLEEVKEKAPEYRVYIEDIMLKKEYMLDDSVEEALATLSPVLHSSIKGYETTKIADIEFESFVVRGKEYPNSYVLYENMYQYNPDLEIRRRAFESFSNGLKKYQNTTAFYYQNHIQKEKIISAMRGFSSVFDYLLLDQKVTKEMYHRQIDLIMKELAPYMQKYAALLKKIYHLDKITFADLKIPVDKEIVPRITIEESKKYVREALSVLGEEYVDLIMSSYEERWVDFAQNIGKSTGGFCATPYGKHSFILLSWTGLLSEVFTLVHELGHAGHFTLNQRENSYLNQELSLYFVEAPSTMNELLLTNYLLKDVGVDKRMKRWVLSNMISNTYFHNFVTHLLEAAYQREVYKRVDRGESLQAEDLSMIKKNVLQEFWGEDVEITDGAELTWMRQPHYYMGLYSYTYSAGLTIGTQMSNRIKEEGFSAAQDWIKVLKAGGTKNPVELAQMAGIDITTDKPLLDTIHFIGSAIKEIIQLTEELEKN